MIPLLMLCNTAISQLHGGVEQYAYAGPDQILTIVPKAYYQDKNNWYGEIRYNYDELETFSINAGKTFSREGAISYSITPMAGLMAGKFNGCSLGLNIESTYRKLFFSAESQYAFSADKRNTGFFFNWSELYCKVTANIYAGLALQLTHLYKTTNQWEPGLTAGVAFGKFTFPLYIFNSTGNSRYFVLGINIEWGAH